MFTKRIITSPLAVLLLLLLQMGGAQAVPFAFDYGININGDAQSPPFGGVFPSNVDDSRFDGTNGTETGLGTLVVTITTPGSHAVDAYFDYDFDEPSNSFFNELGAGNNLGDIAVGQTFEIDDAGLGDIFDNWLANALDEANPTMGQPADIAVALGWDFTLAANEIATIIFEISETMPNSGFFLTHSDPDSPDQAYFSSSLTIDPIVVNPNPIPEPATFGLMMLGGLGLWTKKQRLS